MPAKRSDRDQILESAHRAIHDNVLQLRGEATLLVAKQGGGLEQKVMQNVWRCAKPFTNNCSFWVAELPGLLVQWGDIGGIMIAQWGGYGVDWLEGAIDSIDYVLSKSNHKRTRFVAEAFEEYIRGNDINFEEEVGRPLDKPVTWEDYNEFINVTRDSEVYECSHDWETDALWAWAALKRFCVLRKEARGNEAGNVP